MPIVTVIQPTITEEKAVRIRCAAYCRVSSDSEDQLNSFMAQTRYYSRIFENSETEVLIDIYADVKHGKGNEKNNNKKLKQQKFTGKYDFQKHNNA